MSANMSMYANSTQFNDCLEYKLPNIFVFIFGFITLLFGIMGSFLTWIYLFLFRRTSRSSTRITNATTTTTTTTTNCNKNKKKNNNSKTFSANVSMSGTNDSSANGSDIQPKQVNLRASTQLLMASLAFVDMCGQITSCLRYTILALTQYDLRLLYTDFVCRLQLFIEYCSQDSSAWFMCIMTVERFWLMARPTSNYSLDKKQLTPAALGLLISGLITMGKNAVLLAASQDVCSEGYKDKTFFMIDLVYKCLIPFVILIITSFGNLILMHKQLIKMHSQHMTIKKGLSIVTMTKKDKSNLPPTTAAMWEVIFACRMMIVSSVIFLIGALPMNLFKLANSSFKNVLTARDICSVTDIIYNMINIFFWTCVGLRFYIYIFSSPRVRHDMFLIGHRMLVKLNCLKELKITKPNKNKTGQQSNDEKQTSNDCKSTTDCDNSTSQN